MAEYRGVKGSVKIGANTMAKVAGWEFTPSRPYLETTSMGDTAKKGDLDYPGGRGRMTVRFDYSDAAQKALLDMLISNDDPTPLAFEGVVSSTTKKLTCNILPTSAPISGRVGGHFEASFDFEADGAVSVTWT